MSLPATPAKTLKPKTRNPASTVPIQKSKVRQLLALEIWTHRLSNSTSRRQHLLKHSSKSIPNPENFDARIEAIRNQSQDLNSPRCVNWGHETYADFVRGMEEERRVRKMGNAGVKLDYGPRVLCLRDDGMDWVRSRKGLGKGRLGEVRRQLRAERKMDEVERVCREWAKAWKEVEVIRHISRHLTPEDKVIWDRLKLGKLD